MLRDGRFELEATPSTRALGGRAARVLTDPVGQLTALEGEDGAVHFREGGWGWAAGLRSPGGLLGYLLVSAGKPPPDEDRFLVYALAQLTGAALYNAEARRRDREYADSCSGRSRSGTRSTNDSPRWWRSWRKAQRTVHDVLGPDLPHRRGGARHRRRRVRADRPRHPCRGPLRKPTPRAGPVPPEPDTKPDPLQREQLMHEAMRELGPIRHEGRLVGLARHRGEPLGSIELIKPTARRARPKFALEHACTALSLELAHRRSLAEAELDLAGNSWTTCSPGQDQAARGRGHRPRPAQDRTTSRSHSGGERPPTTASWERWDVPRRDGACGRCWPDEATWRCSWSGASRATRVCCRASPTKWAPRTAR